MNWHYLHIFFGIAILNVRQLCNIRDSINALSIPFQNPILDHVTPDGCGVIVELGNDRVEVFLGVSGGGGELSGNSMEDCDLLGRFNWD